MTASECRSARRLLGWEPADLALAAEISIFAVRNFESEKAVPRRSHIAAMRHALEGASITFTASGPKAANRSR